MIRNAIAAFSENAKEQEHADLVVWLMEQLATGPVMPEIPSDELLASVGNNMDAHIGNVREFYHEIRYALAREQGL